MGYSSGSNGRHGERSEEGEDGDGDRNGMRTRDQERIGHDEWEINVLGENPTSRRHDSTIHDGSAETLEKMGGDGGQEMFQRDVVRC